MVKIKRKVEKNLPQLIEWAWENDVRNKKFESEGGYSTYFDYDGCLTLTKEFQPQDFFTVEVEEEITEDTAIPKMIETYLDRERDFDYVDIHRSLSINNVKDDSDSDCKSITFHIINDDGTHTLIWRDGKLVE